MRQEEKKNGRQKGKVNGRQRMLFYDKYLCWNVALGENGLVREC